MAQLKESIHFLGSAEINTIGGLRIEFSDSWMLIRPSGTEPVIRVIAESTSRARTDELIEKGAELVQNLVEANL